MRAIALDGVLPTSAPPPTLGSVSKRAFYGRVDVTRFTELCRATRLDLRVYFNGEDVTDRCLLAHDQQDYVLLYDVVNGRKLSCPKQHVGLVEILPRQPAGSLYR